jgi:hypothetical protein
MHQGVESVLFVEDRNYKTEQARLQDHAQLCRREPS